MKKLFQLNNIGLQEMVDEVGLDIFISYTEALLTKRILIKFYEAEIGDGEGESAVFAICCNEPAGYSYTLFHGFEPMKLLVVFRVVADAIQFISACSSETF